MTELEQLIAKFDRDYPDDMRLAREALKTDPLKASDHLVCIDITAALLCHEINRLRDELETERMRLVACSVIALANTPESAARARDMHPDYQSPYCDDVARAVDREIALRAELAECKRDAERYRWLRLSAMDHHGGIQYDVFCEADSPDELDDLIDYEINALALEETK